MNMDAARLNMLKQQIRACGVRDENIFNVIAQTPRHDYVPEKFKALAYADAVVSLAHDQEMLMPQVEALMLEALKIQKTDIVLEIGTGSGYMTSLLAKLAAYVYSIDIFEDFKKDAIIKLESESLTNVNLITGDGMRGWREYAPYDVIVVTGGMPVLSEELLEQLRPQGRLFAILGSPPSMTGTLLRRQGAHLHQTELFNVSTKFLLPATGPSKFEF